MVLLDNDSISSVIEFLPTRSIQSCRRICRQWFVIANMVIRRQMPTIFEEIRQMVTPSSEDYRQFCDIYLDRGYDRRFLENVPPDMFQHPRMARMYIMGVIGNPNIVAKLLHRPRWLARVAHNKEWEAAFRDEGALEVIKGITRGGHCDFLQTQHAWFSKDMCVMAHILEIAARYGHADIIRTCIDLYAQTHETLRPPQLERIVYVAAKYGHIDIVRLCITQHGVNPRYALCPDVYKNAPRLSECIRLCCSHGCDVDIKHGNRDEEWYGEPMISAVARHGNVDAVQTCIDLGSRHVDDALASAAIAGRPDIIRRCHQHGGNIDAFMRFQRHLTGRPAIFGAAHFGHLEAVQTCLELGSTRKNSAMAGVIESLDNHNPDGAPMIDMMRYCSNGVHIDTIDPTEKNNAYIYAGCPLIIRATLEGRSGSADVAGACVDLGSNLALEAAVIAVGTGRSTIIRALCDRSDSAAAQIFLDPHGHLPPPDEVARIAFQHMDTVNQQCDEWSIPHVAEEVSQAISPDRYG